MYLATRVYCYFSIFMYVALSVLNFFWFYKMFSGLLKFFNKSGKTAKPAKVE